MITRSTANATGARAIAASLTASQRSTVIIVDSTVGESSMSAVAISRTSCNSAGCVAVMVSLMGIDRSGGTRGAPGTSSERVDYCAAAARCVAVKPKLNVELSPWNVFPAADGNVIVTRRKLSVLAVTLMLDNATLVPMTGADANTDVVVPLQV